MSGNKSIIVKKVKKVHGGGHHGGAWKVAYADFVTAMMAFFLLLWLLSMTSDEKRARVSSYFKYFSIYDSGGTSWMEKSSEIFGEAGENRQKVFSGQEGQTISNSETTVPPLVDISKALEKDIAEKLGDLKDQVIVDIVDNGIRIQMTDKNGSLMFDRGMTKLTAKAREILKVISENINKHKDKVIIEGHTDSLPYAGSTYSNWELSTERASSARIALEAAGLDPKRIARVAGYADTDPLIKENPEDPKNRRISIILNIPNEKEARPVLPAGKTSITATDTLTKKNDYDSIINAGHDMLKNGDSSSLTKTNNPSVKKKKKSNAKQAVKAPPIIEGLSNPVIQVINKDRGQTVLPAEKTNIVAPEDRSSTVIKKHDYDSIINEGQDILKNGDSSSSTKTNNSSAKKKNISNEKYTDKAPPVIKKLSNPVFQ